MKRMSLIVLLLGGVFTGNVFAFDLEKLFSPGELISGHQKAGKDCKNCHVRGRNITQNRLCLDCHEKVDEDISAKRGFHGLNKKIISSDCRSCHSDHKGKQANIVILDRDHFNHDLTDYRLKGKHQKVVCKQCHQADLKFREAASNCIDCHKEDDIHKGKLGKKCASCHNPKAWTSEQFDHDKTDFKLRQAHKKVACNLCHVENRYKDTPKKCVSCHAIKDVHLQRFGSQCQQCHQQNRWKDTHFDHFKDAGYRLKGAHQAVTCHACHALADKGKFDRDNPRICIDCHRLDDVHKGKNGDQCENCHGEKNWGDSSFRHDRDTKFKLNGAHKKASCEACHQRDVKGKKTDSDCYSCHQHQDAHDGEQGKQCGECHNDSSWWLEDVRFDHDLSQFPLIGQHAVAGCESCHLNSKFKVEKQACRDCHSEDDVHEKKLGQDCQRCHNPNDWLIWQFNHDDETDFKIMGAHQELSCNQCHKNAMDKPRERPRDCIACHRQDDVHNGEFGTDCSRCHIQDDFTTLNKLTQSHINDDVNKKPTRGIHDASTFGK